MNLLLLPTIIGFFIYLGAQKMDGENDISYFVLMIPVWVAIIPFFAYIIINGLAA